MMLTGWRYPRRWRLLKVALVVNLCTYAVARPLVLTSPQWLSHVWPAAAVS